MLCDVVMKKERHREKKEEEEGERGAEVSWCVAGWWSLCCVSVQEEGLEG
jgi:hypothetical protein